MKPPVLQTEWYNRASFDPQGTASQVEAYHLRAHDPQTGRALWVRLSLSGDKHRRVGSVRAIFIDPVSNKNWMAVNRFEQNRLLLDPERPGAGIGESMIEDGSSIGIVRGNGFSLTWNLNLTQLAQAYMPLPSPRLYQGGLLPTKWVSSMPVARASGSIEVWTNAHHEDGHTRDAKETEIRLDGWDATVGHSWGSHHPGRYAWAHCGHFYDVHEPASFELFAADVELAGGLLHIPATLGRLQVGHHTYRFDTFRTLRSAQSSYGPDRWVFELDGPDGSLTGRVSGHTSYGMVLDGPDGRASHAAVSPVADLELHLRPRVGPHRQLTSHSAILEVGQAGDRGGVDVVL